MKNQNERLGQVKEELNRLGRNEAIVKEEEVSPVQLESGLDAQSAPPSLSPLEPKKKMDFTSSLAAKICLLKMKYPSFFRFLICLFLSVMMIRTGFFLYQSISTLFTLPTCHMMAPGAVGLQTT